MNKQDAEEFFKRRQKVLDSLGDTVYLRLSNYEHTKNSDVHFSFRQDSSFVYLTGFPEADSLLILDPQSDKPFCLFVRPKDRTREIWDGFRYGKEGAVEEFHVDAAWINTKLKAVLSKRIKGRTVQFTPDKGHPLNKEVEHIIAASASVLAPDMTNTFINRLRMVKSAWEIKQMRKAAAISSQAHNILQQKAPELDSEYHMEAEYLHECMSQGARDQAYPPIVAGGANATCLHYNINNMTVGKNDMVLIDAGCSWNNYASDITRTFSRTRKFTSKQKSIYNAVLDTHKKTVAAVKPGVTQNELHELAAELIAGHLIDLKLLKCSKDEAIEKKRYQEFYPHSIGHHLGLDVHDCDGLTRDDRRQNKLEANMVITIEPGIYIQPDNEDVPKSWLGLAVRIEDDILVTKDGNDNLTEAAFKELKDLED